MKEQTPKERDYQVYIKPDTQSSADKAAHKLRSEGNDQRTGGSHQDHWKREKKKKD